MPNPGGKEASRALILELTRAGFTQLRKTNDGYLWGAGLHRFLLPYAVAQGSAHPDYVAELRQQFYEVRSNYLADKGRRPKEVEAMEPVPNPEDLLRDDEGGPPVADTGAMNPADEGSTPSPPANTAEAADHPDPEEETTMPIKRNRRGHAIPLPWTCPKCGQTFKQQGRHFSVCTGKPKPDKPSPNKPTKAVDGALGAVAVQNGHGILENFEIATASLLAHLKALQGELQHYRRETDELRAFKQRASALFGPDPKVPRA